MTGRTRERNQARLVRCSADCGTLVWLAGALPCATDAEFVCPTCKAGGCPASNAGGTPCVRPDHTDELHLFAGTPEAADYMADRAKATS